ncbi:MAG TPA: helix-turn-helix domain-containing protein, partial [bacterium]|nr:helix-turn-helix domain-containing protein [bacterium]
MELTVKDVVRLFNVSERTVYRWIQSANLPAYKVNEQYRFNRVEMLEWATA